ncbi:MAG: FAD-binding oxidoreductase [Planctomycetes bacterium]|nr:FAD-binding oxidoreductase [Planctomycetota bacterium]
MATVTTSQTPDLASSPSPVEVAESIRAAYDASRAVYPVGGGTALNYGNSPTQPGEQLDLTGLNRIVDYTPRDMTILVEAGVRMTDLAAALAAEGQHLPIDVPRASEATLGGVVATNWSGPRRYGHGTIRDYVIGIHAVDGRGVAFKGGGRVVKNVAGYDFCKLLTGSLGTLGVITQLALKVKPLPESTGTVVAACADVATAGILLDRLATLPVPPVAIDYLLGPNWQVPTTTRSRQAEIGPQTPHLVIRFEGTETETAWLADQIQTELQQAGGMSVALLAPIDAAALWKRQIEFADRGAGDAPENSPMVIKVAVPPSAVTKLVAQLVAFDPDCSIQAHAASGIVIARFAKFGHSDITPVLVGKLRPAAAKLGGSLVVISGTLDGLTPHLIWGGRTDAIVLMENIKRKFDPRNILNPGRFVY